MVPRSIITVLIILLDYIKNYTYPSSLPKLMLPAPIIKTLNWGPGLTSILCIGWSLAGSIELRREPLRWPGADDIDITKFFLKFVKTTMKGKCVTEIKMDWNKLRHHFKLGVGGSSAYKDFI